MLPSDSSSLPHCHCLSRDLQHQSPPPNRVCNRIPQEVGKQGLGPPDHQVRLPRGEVRAAVTSDKQFEKQTHGAGGRGWALECLCRPLEHCPGMPALLFMSLPVSLTPLKSTLLSGGPHFPTGCLNISPLPRQAAFLPTSNSHTYVPFVATPVCSKLLL